MWIQSHLKDHDGDDNDIRIEHFLSGFKLINNLNAHW